MVRYSHLSLDVRQHLQREVPWRGFDSAVVDILLTKRFWEDTIVQYIVRASRLWENWEIAEGW